MKSNDTPTSKRPDRHDQIAREATRGHGATRWLLAFGLGLLVVLFAFLRMTNTGYEGHWTGPYSDAFARTFGTTTLLTAVGCAVIGYRHPGHAWRYGVVAVVAPLLMLIIVGLADGPALSDAGWTLNFINQFVVSLGFLAALPAVGGFVGERLRHRIELRVEMAYRGGVRDGRNES